MEVEIDGRTANTAANMRYRGLGMVSANNSSRLLLDYRHQQPQAYQELLQLLFGSAGLGISHLKLEMGSDINSSSGTEPSLMRRADEAADARRGAGFRLAADAKAINPDLTLDLLWWGEPLWVSQAANVHRARYAWYKANLDAAWQQYGLRFDYVSAVQNERGADLAWIKYLAAQLKAETGCPYPYGDIRIVAGDEVCTWNLADRMLEDPDLRQAIDVVGSHYTSWSSPAAQELARVWGKELWFSEGCPPMAHAAGIWRHEGSGGGLGGINGVLDIANRFITMYPGGRMTLCQFQPAVAAYYDGVSYCHKQFIAACDPWSGYYHLDSGYFMALHFARFFRLGWTFIDSACQADGRPGGDGHALVDATHCFMTAADPASGDYSMVITNTTAAPLTYQVRVSSLQQAAAPLQVWETRGPDFDAAGAAGPGQPDQPDPAANYFRLVDRLVPVPVAGQDSGPAAAAGDSSPPAAHAWSLVVKPWSMVTITTLQLERPRLDQAPESARTVLALPYSDDFRYAGEPGGYLAARGQAPRYTTDQGGAFEVGLVDGQPALVQQITPDIRAKEWGWTPDPTTNLGDDRWFNYRVTARVRFDQSGTPGTLSASQPAPTVASQPAAALDPAAVALPPVPYVGLGLRYIQANAGPSGWWIRLAQDGQWSLCKHSEVLASGSLLQAGGPADNLIRFDPAGWTTLAIEAREAGVAAWVNGVPVVRLAASPGSGLPGAGRAALYSSWHRNCFRDLQITPLEGCLPAIRRLDDTDLACTYAGPWRHDTMAGFRHYRRTLANGTAGARLTVIFNGTGVALLGEQPGDGVVSLELDGHSIEPACRLSRTSPREVAWCRFGLPGQAHRLVLTVLEGSFSLDSLEITGDPAAPVASHPAGPGASQAGGTGGSNGSQP